MDWDEQITDGIRTCESLLCILTHNSIEEESECKREWTLALSYDFFPGNITDNTISPERSP